VFELVVMQERLRRERLEAQLLHRVGQELGRTLDLQELLNSVLDLLGEVVPYNAAAIYLLGDEGLDAVHVRGYAEGQVGFVKLKLNQGIVGWTARTGEAEIVGDVRRDTRYLEARPETRSEMVVPLRSGGRIIGVFNLESDRIAAYNPHDLELLETFGGQAAAALERARLLAEEKAKQHLDQELAIARRIQKSFFPKMSDSLRERNLTGRTISSQEVSGDFFEFLERDDGSVAIALADVSGKGIPAALIMASLQAAFRLGAVKEDDPAALCRGLNTFLHGSTRDTEFVTGVFGFLDRDQRRFRFCNAGHEAPLLVQENGDVEWRESGGMMLGAFPDLDFTGDEVELGTGDLLILYTDGVTEAHRGDYDEFGPEGLLAAVQELAGACPETVSEAIVKAVRRFVAGPLPDDLTLVVVGGGEGA
jgi:serine phosphatase RsbU (regulator of sigma subunit)